MVLKKISKNKKNENILISKEKNIENDRNLINVYTDGSCLNNGESNAIAGIGVYFGKNDNRNISEKICGIQTNNVAELNAIDKAFNILKKYINTNYIQIHYMLLLFNKLWLKIGK